MRRAELIQALEEMEVTYRLEWSVPELRATLLEEREARGMGKEKKMTGLSHMTVEALKAKCQEEEIFIPEKATRGALMKMLRDQGAPTNNEVVCFGGTRASSSTRCRRTISSGP